MRIGILGLGHAGLGHYTALSRNPEVSVTAVADTDPARLSNRAKPIEVPQASRYQRPDKLIETESIDALVVATPPSTHAEYVSEALDRDVHVLCEKPLCLRVSTGRELCASARESDAILRVGFQRRVDPAYRAAREQLEDESVHGFDVAMYSDWFQRFRGTWRTNPSVSGGGHLLDMGSHFVDLLRWLTGRDLAAVSAEMTFVDEDWRVDSQATLLLRLRDDVLGTMRFLTAESRAYERVELYGTQTVTVEATDWDERSLTVGSPSGTQRHGSPDTATDQATEFVDAVRGADDDLATGTDGLWVVRVMRAAYESARSGDTVPITETV